MQGGETEPWPNRTSDSEREYRYEGGLDTGRNALADLDQESITGWYNLVQSRFWVWTSRFWIWGLSHLADLYPDLYQTL